MNSKIDLYFIKNYTGWQQCFRALIPTGHTKK